jgi:hypothetical protein
LGDGATVANLRLASESDTVRLGDTAGMGYVVVE